MPGSRIRRILRDARLGKNGEARVEKTVDAVQDFIGPHIQRRRHAAFLHHVHDDQFCG